ncbi:TonB-dependent receptor plug domain-containing protein [Rugamonas sp. CCM 8940]|uniref:TonB-dependent receptor plug domain-containing protein n=1 Tax=Rugamonas sp. CCM 8940 TaxID=2765359 RepID=UPI0018F63809|nr:TonB-dependent receptor [Rugamonas sp. CCM 8940]MBJ7310925.1 TonB-dependent receptor [Rugamonas sp. CCM 8940]
MPRLRRHAAWPIAAGLLAALPAAVPARAAGAADDLFNISVQELLNLPIETASRHLQGSREAPAIISVVTADDIRQFGYRSVAEALAQVPGMYAIDDQVSPNVGVRGVNAGLRAYSRILKVMIDGQAMAFRADAGNFLGPALLAMEAIERIEVVRGPASALYGADAFLGVVNIITRSAEQTEHSVTLRRGAGQDAGNGLALFSAGRSARLPELQWLLSASGATADRSGLELPRSSPLYARAAAGGAASQDDLSRPRNLLAKLSHQGRHSDSELLLHAYRVDSDAEFLDFGTLSHNNRLAVLQKTARLTHEYRGLADWTLRASLASTSGGPDGRERLSLGAAGNYPQRDFGFVERSASVDVERRLDANQSIAVGLDASNDRERQLRIYNVDLASGQRVLLAGDGSVRNTRQRGVYLQYSVRPWSYLGLTANARRDHHSVFGDNSNYRLALVGELSADLSYKLLYGTSYKAPSALQLYAQPLYPGEVLGNPRLRPETSRSSELGLHWQLAPSLAWSANAYLLTVKDKTELLPAGINLQPQNSGQQKGHGLESELLWQAGAQRVRAQFAWADTNNEDQPRLQELLVAPTASYPRLTLRLSWQYLHPRWGALAVSARHVSPRRASKINSQENLLKPYQLDAYQLLDLNWRRDFGPHGLALRVANLTDRRYAEPGYGGVDLPGAARSVVLSYTYHF